MPIQKSHFFIVLFILALSVPTLFVFIWHRTMYAPLLLRQNTESIKVYPGATIHDVAKTLYDKRLILYPSIFIFAARVNGHAKKLRFGEYVVRPGMNAYSLLSNIIFGQGLVKHKITFIEGWTFYEVLKAIKNDPNLFHRLNEKTDAEIMKLIGDSNSHPEGLFMPETYTFIWGNTDIEILKGAYDRMQSYLLQQWNNRASDLPYKNAYQALIVASLIEKETAVNTERPIIASVILRRLEKRIRLQVDPTVLYGLNKSYGTQITHADLQAQTPYNTYQKYGLPPTPIGIPSKASIYAALHPSHTPFLYYVATGDGTHIFSETYQQHLYAVKKYRALRKQRLGAT